MSYAEIWSKAFGEANESFTDFFKRHGINPSDHLNHLDEIEGLFGEIGLDMVPPEPGPGDLYPSRIPPFGVWHTALRSGDIKKVYPRMNSYGLRSEEFRKDRKHRGKHILFAGCSITAGDSMYEEFVWPFKTYSMIANNEEVSGYYNIGVCGATMSEILRQIFIYIDKFGSPDVLFINFSNLEREGDSELGTRQMLQVLDAEYRALNLYCKLSQTKLYAFTWDHLFALDSEGSFEGDGIDPRPYFENFYKISIRDRERHMQTFIENNVEQYGEDLMLNALDYVHPGMAEHDFYAHFAYSLYRRDHG